MGTPLHTLVASIADTDPAILISHRLLTDLLTRRLRDAISRFVGRYQTYPNKAGIVPVSYTHLTLPTKA